MICQKCGREIADGAAFCPYCGRATGNIAHQTEFNNMVKKEKEKENTDKVCNVLLTMRAILVICAMVMTGYKLGGVIGVVIAVIIIAFILVALSGNNSEEK